LQVAVINIAATRSLQWSHTISSSVHAVKIHISQNILIQCWRSCNSVKYSSCWANQFFHFPCQFHLSTIHRHRQPFPTNHNS